MPRKLVKILTLCYKITASSKCDVFFKYIAHANAYAVYYYPDGYHVFSTSYDLALLSEITDENMDRTIEKLKALAETVGADISGVR